MGLVLDPSIFIAAERKRFDPYALSNAHAADKFVIAAITASEFLHGRERCDDARIKAVRAHFIQEQFSKLPVVPFGGTEARRHARIRAQLESRGERIGAHDLLAAATALSLRYDRATLNRDAFQRVPGLQPTPADSFVQT